MSWAMRCLAIRWHWWCTGLVCKIFIPVGYEENKRESSSKLVIWHPCKHFSVHQAPTNSFFNKVSFQASSTGQKVVESEAPFFTKAVISGVRSKLRCAKRKQKGYVATSRWSMCFYNVWMYCNYISYIIYVSIRHLNCPEIPATNNFCIVKGLVLQVPVSEHLVHQRVLAADTWLKLWPKDTHSRSTCLRNTLLSFAPYRRYGKGHEGVFKLMVVKKSTNLRNNCCTSNRRTPILFLLREFEIRILG